MLIKLEGLFPKVHDSAYVENSAQLIGNVEIAEQASVWYNAVIRADLNSIYIGKRTNVQDLCVIHVTKEFPVIIGNDVTIGHGVLIHGCKIHDSCLIGMGSTILDESELGPECLVAAHTLIPPRFKAEPRSLLMGVPARKVRDITKEELNMIQSSAQHYVEYSQRFRKSSSIISIIG